MSRAGGLPPKTKRPPTYDRIGQDYAHTRRPDPRLAVVISAALHGARRVLNVGAGTGSYEPQGCDVVAVEPSAVMLGQHPGTRRVRGDAAMLPVGTGAFDASMAVLTVHHWDLARGLAELRRVSRRQVVFAWDPDHDIELWMLTEYLPGVRTFERSRHPPVAQVADLLSAHTIVPFAIPHDFTDGFQHAFWRRPEAFLDRRVRAASSMYALLPPAAVAPAIARLRDDLRSGSWAASHAELLARQEMDYGYRIVIAGKA